MKTVTIIALALAISSNAFAGVAANQHNRIAQGVASGSLTKGETKVLVNQQNNIKSAIQSGASASTVKTMQVNASNLIYTLKHN